MMDLLLNKLFVGKQLFIYYCFDTEVKQCVVGDPYPVKQLYKNYSFPAGSRSATLMVMSISKSLALT